MGLGVRKFFAVAVAAIVGATLSVQVAHADNRRTDRTPLIKNPIKAIDMFNKGYAVDFFPGEVVEVENEEGKGKKPEAVEKTEDTKGQADSKSAQVDKATEHKKSSEAPLSADEKLKGPVFVGDYESKDSLAPDETPRVRINKEAPAPFINMADSHMRGDKETAAKYADQYVRYQQNFFFEVRELTQLIGEALIRQKQIDEDDWHGVPQLIDYEFAKTRRETGDVFKPSHDVAMERIKPDTHNQAEIYYFFNFNCAWCRYMAPDVERLYQSVKNDPNIKIVGLTMGATPKDWMKEYREYTGLTMPILEGEKIAKAFNVRFVPALVVVAPNGKRAYLKTGAQTFDHMYEFVRKVQGLPVTVTPELQRIASLKIGEIENAKVEPGKNLDVWLRDENERKDLERRLNSPGTTAKVKKTSQPVRGKKVTLEKF